MEGNPRPRRKRRIPDLESRSSSSSESDFDVRPPGRHRSRPAIDSDSQSDSSIDVTRKKRINRPMLISESDDSSSSDSEIVRRPVGPHRINSSDFESDWSVNSDKPGESSKAKPAAEAGSSSDSDGQSDKCPICLLSFKTQEVGSPESCDHSFCVECILEWSKNMNTCPVDRQPFNLILVRSDYNGKVVRQVPVERNELKVMDNIVFDDPTYCEVCGDCDREERMLLCDGCDLGYHLECLTPPLSEVPLGAWFCGSCNQMDDGEGDNITIHLQQQRRQTQRNTIRLMPRTRQSERVRTTILTNRVQRSQRNEPTSSVRRKRKTRRRTTRRTAKSKIKITYAIDEETGQKIVIETKGRKSRRRKRKRTRVSARRAAQQPKTVKKRLAVQLGICVPRSDGQTLPDVRVSVEGNRIGVQRSRAGIPALNIFGARDQLDYFSGSDADNENEGDGGTLGLLRARRPNFSDAAIFRRSTMRKGVLLSTPSTSSCDVLGSILDSQEKFHSKNAVLSVRKDGTIKVDKKAKTSVNNNNERVNLNNPQNFRVRHAPTSNTAEPSSNSNMNTSSDEYRNSINIVTNSTVTTSSGNSVSTSSGGSGDCPMEPTQNSSINTSCGNDYVEPSKKSGTNSPKSDSELDIYSDIETVSTSKTDEAKPPPSPPPVAHLNIQSDDEANNSDSDLIIDTEKVEEKAPQPEEEPPKQSKEEDVTSTTICPTPDEPEEERSCDEDADSEDGCPNFSIYSAESIKLAKTTDLELLNQESNVGSSLDITNQEKAHSETPQENPVSMEDLIPEEPRTPEAQEEEEGEVRAGSPEEPMDSSINEDGNVSESPAADTDSRKVAKPKKPSDPTVLYSDSDDEVAKVEQFNIGDLRSMTEDISEEERSYTPCLDERQPVREGLEGLDTEAISDEEKNDFDEAQEQELKTASDGGDALEINAKECELDFTKPEEYEEGEIVDKLKKLEEAKKAETNNNVEQSETPPIEKEVVTNGKEKESPGFKKISKSNKDRNYRDKEKEGAEKSPEKESKSESQKKKERKKEKRKEIERYNVRTVVAEKPRRIKDKFGRDCRRRSLTRSSRSTSPPHNRSPSRGRRSYSRDKNRKRRGRTISRSRSRKRSRSRNRRRTVSRGRKRTRRSLSRTKARKKNRSVSRHRSRSVTPKRRKDWERRWSPSPSRSRSPLTPSWTPPRVLEKQPVKPHNLTVILTNDSNKKKKDKKRGEKKKKEGEKQKKRKRDKTPPPSKEVFASGDNILVSVSFNDEREREATIKRKRDDDLTTKRTRKEKERVRKERSPRTKKKNKELAGVKPVAIIDLDRSPFKELTPSPKDIIVLSDSENGETREEIVCDSSQQPDYTTGPKTPPEPQVKFSLNAKAPQLRAINNPLHEPDDMDAEMDPQEELEARLADTLHKGPNTPPEPPNSPPSSPDAYDPFDPTKSRSPTPDNTSNVQSCLAQSSDNNLNEASDAMEKAGTQLSQTPDISHTPPVITDIQPADSQSNASTNTPDHNAKQTPPERIISVVINQQVVQSQPSSFPQSSKSSAQPTYSSAASTATTANLTSSRINILNTTILQPVMSSLPQRIVLPTTTKSSPIKVAPTKPTIKSTPIKPMPNKNITKPARKTNNRNNDANNTVDLDSPYSPGPSDYEDLFEPPSETVSKSKKPSKSGGTGKSGGGGTFDSLFGSSPTQRMKKQQQDKKKKGRGANTKMVGVKVDEDSVKILDDVPNSAVEMQVKDKFLKKLNRQERVVEEVKLVLKPHYNKKHINKEDYKDILRRSVPKICHNKTGEINPKKIQNLIEAYVKKVRHSKKVTSSSSVNPQK